MNEDVNDPVVAERYREIAAEKAPDALNQAVLRQARQQAGSHYSRTVAWLRPMAWAASIGLCLAIVLELNDIPRPEPSMMQIPAAVPAPAKLADEEAVASDPDTPAAPAPGLIDAPSEAEPEALTESMEQRARKSVDEDGRVSLDDLAQLEKSAAAEQFEAPRGGDFATVDAPDLEELETLTRLREGDNTSEIPVDSAAADSVGSMSDRRDEAKQEARRDFAAAAAPSTERAISAACGPTQRETPEAWLECILGLKIDGMAEQAAREREQLQAAYPEFEMP